MTNSYFHYFFILIIIIGKHNLISSERRLTEEEWHQMRFGSDATQWALNNGAEPQTNVENGQNSSDADDGPIETNVQTVDVGKDKLVLVNDQGTIKMLRASQLPNKPLVDTNTTPQTPALQAPYNTYFDAKGTNTSPSLNPVEYITPNFGAGHKVAGLPVAFASGSSSGSNTDRPNVIYQKFEENTNPCRVATNSPPIYIPAPQIPVPNTSSRPGKMVRIIIEMPESMTKNIDEASRYAASQVKRLKLPAGYDMNQEIAVQTASGMPQTQKKVKNVQQIIRKVIHLEEDDETDGNSGNNGEDGESSGDEEVVSQQRDNHKFVAFKTDKNRDGIDEKRILLLRNGGGFGRRNGKNGDLRAVDKYKKVIKIYRN